MLLSKCSTAGLIALLAAATLHPSDGHGLIESPPSRNWICGVITKPDHVSNGVATYPQCGDAFDYATEADGYQFMSVLTHDVGRSGVTPLPSHVCGFESETWKGDVTPYDYPMAAWPTNSMSAGRNEIKWNIFWGSHFDDTEEFRYWITKPDFTFDPNTELTWNDFETAPFCVLFYDDTNPNANPDVVPDHGSAVFSTYCDVPARSGRHVIYGEWGRTPSTYERFHGCIDVEFASVPTAPSPPTPPPPPTPGPAVDAVISLSPNSDPFEGSGTITLDGSGSQGNGISYLWSITTSGDPSKYTIDDDSASTTTLTLAEPASSQAVEISLMVSNSLGSDSASTNFIHIPVGGSTWVDLGPLTTQSVVMDVGDEVSVRAIDSNGVDMYYPTPGLTITSSNRWADNWPYHLSQAVTSAAPIKVGILNTATDEVVGAWSTTGNHIYAYTGTDVVSAFLNVGSTPAPAPSPAPPTAPTPPTGGGPSADCSVVIQAGSNPYWAGLMVGFPSSKTAQLDFSNTDLDLSTVNFNQGVFASGSGASGQIVTLANPGWVSQTNAGQMSFGGSNVAALATFTLPVCTTS